jgi:hypothetical protein
LRGLTNGQHIAHCDYIIAHMSKNTLTVTPPSSTSRRSPPTCVRIARGAGLGEPGEARRRSGYRRPGSCHRANVVGRHRERRGSPTNVVARVRSIDAVGWRGAFFDLNIEHRPPVLRLNDLQGEIQVRNDEVRDPARDRVLHRLNSAIDADPNDLAAIIHAEE